MADQSQLISKAKVIGNKALEIVGGMLESEYLLSDHTVRLSYEELRDNWKHGEYSRLKKINERVYTEIKFSTTAIINTVRVNHEALTAVLPSDPNSMATALESELREFVRMWEMSQGQESSARGDSDERNKAPIPMPELSRLGRELAETAARRAGKQDIYVPLEHFITGVYRGATEEGSVLGGIQQSSEALRSRTGAGYLGNIGAIASRGVGIEPYYNVVYGFTQKWKEARRSQRQQEQQEQEKTERTQDQEVEEEEDRQQEEKQEEQRETYQKKKQRKRKKETAEVLAEPMDEASFMGMGERPEGRESDGRVENCIMEIRDVLVEWRDAWYRSQGINPEGDTISDAMKAGLNYKGLQEAVMTEQRPDEEAEADELERKSTEAVTETLPNLLIRQSEILEDIYMVNRKQALQDKVEDRIDAFLRAQNQKEIDTLSPDLTDAQKKAEQQRKERGGLTDWIFELGEEILGLLGLKWVLGRGGGRLRRKGLIGSIINALRGGIGGVLSRLKGVVGLLRGVAKIIPWATLATLPFEYFAARDEIDVHRQRLESGEITQEEYERQRHGVIGSVAGRVTGLAAGAAAGAAAGSVVPVVGTAVGAVVGGAMGYIGGDIAGELLFEKFSSSITTFTDTLGRFAAWMGSWLGTAWDKTKAGASKVSDWASSAWEATKKGVGAGADFVGQYTGSNPLLDPLRSNKDSDVVQAREMSSGMYGPPEPEGLRGTKQMEALTGSQVELQMQQEERVTVGGEQQQGQAVETVELPQIQGPVRPDTVAGPSFVEGSRELANNFAPVAVGFEDEISDMTKLAAYGMLGATA